MELNYRMKIRMKENCSESEGKKEILGLIKEINAIIEDEKKKV